MEATTMATSHRSIRGRRREEEKVVVPIPGGRS
jgi:hypothetical protein